MNRVRQFNLVENKVKLVIKDNLLAVISTAELNAVSTAIYNGGFKKTKAILNAQVLDEYGDRRLHEDPLKFIRDSGKRLDLPEGFVGMVTAAKIKNFSLIKKKQGDLAVSVVVTAGCSHAESAGEKIGLDEIMGTINVIVVVDGNPSESCMIAALATAVEAKAAAMRDLDVRSRYSGDAATGTITDSLVVAATGVGEAVGYGGPASELGQLVGHCVRNAVKAAVTNQGECLPVRSVAERLRERQLPIEKIACELAKIKGLGMDEAALAARLAEVLEEKPFFASLVLAAVKIDEDVEKGLVPPEFGKIEVFRERLGEFLSKKSGGKTVKKAERVTVDLPPFLREVLVAILESGVSGEKSARLK